jgi:hypothetical protein
MSYKVFYKGEDANYPAFNTEKEALDFYVKQVSRETGETREEILAEYWPSPRGNEGTVQVREVDEEE